MRHIVVGKFPRDFSMGRTTVAACINLCLGLLSPVLAEPGADEKRQAARASEVFSVVKAQLYEVDDAFYKKLTTHWLSEESLENLERAWLNAPPKKQPEITTLLNELKNQKLLLAGKEISIDPGKEAVLLAMTKIMNCLPSPEQRRLGQDASQAIKVGASLEAEVHIGVARRSIRVKFMEKSLEVEGIEKVNLDVDIGGQKIAKAAEIASLREASLSQTRYIPDGGVLLLPLQYRPRAVRDNNRWLVVLVEARIYIKAEEKAIRAWLTK